MGRRIKPGVRARIAGNADGKTSPRSIAGLGEQTAETLAELLRVDGNEVEIAHDGLKAVEMAEKFRPGVVLLDISVPDKNGIDTLRLLRHVKPDLPVLMLSAYGEDQYAVNLLRAGAAGYLNKEAASTQLVGAIRTVVQGRKYVSPSLAQILADGVSGDGEKPLHAELSQREFQIFCKLAAGAAVSKIADELNLSVKTVSTYRTRILEKMAMKSNADLTYYAIKNGLIE